MSTTPRIRLTVTDPAERTQPTAGETQSLAPAAVAAPSRSKKTSANGDKQPFRDCTNGVDPDPSKKRKKRGPKGAHSTAEREAPAESLATTGATATTGTVPASATPNVEIVGQHREERDGK